MKALTTFIALSIIAISITFPAPTQITSGGDAPQAVASLEPETLSHRSREIPAQRRPWFADYPLTIDVGTNRIYASDPDRVREVQDVLGRFAGAGIDLPDLEIWTHDDLSGCRLSVEDDTPPAGVYFQRAGVDTVFLCGTTFTLIHELAHSHDNNFLTDAERNEFLSIRDADSWRNGTWSRAAGEHFADVVAWGLMNGEVRPSRTMPNDNASLDDAFELAMSFQPGVVREPVMSPVERQLSDDPGIYGATESERRDIRAKISLFATAGLRLPQLRIYVHGSTAGCGGHSGLFDKDRSGQRIDICGNVVLHELAHAWELHNMSNQTRQAFMDYTGLDVWNHADTDHKLRAIERAATVVAWGVGKGQLTAGEAPMYEEHLLHYEMLTGVRSPKLAGIPTSDHVDPAHQRIGHPPR